MKKKIRIGVLLLLCFCLCGCFTDKAFWIGPEYSKAKSLEKLVEIEREKLELEKQKQAERGE